MGQVTLPVLNRKGYSSVWENSWDDVKNYSNIINEDTFLQQYMMKMLVDQSSQAYTLSPTLRKHNYAKYKYLSFLEKGRVYKRQELNKILESRFKRVPSYFSRIFIIRYNSWIVLYTYIYIPKVWKKRLNKKKKTKANLQILFDIYSHQTRKIKCHTNTFIKTF